MPKKILALSSLLVILILFHLFIYHWQKLFWWMSIFEISIISILVIYLTMYFQKKYESQIAKDIYQKLQQVFFDEINTKFKEYQLKDVYELIDKIKDERLKQLEYFKKLDSYRKEYLGNVSHELKTPLFNVQGYISTLLDGASEDPVILNEYLKKADKNIERMINIIDDLETISQLESGSMILDIEDFDIESLIYEVFDQMELLASKKGIQFILKKENTNDVYVVNADKFRIRQVLINLVSNSIKYGKENGKTTIGLQKKQGKIFVCVEDDGIGIEEKHLPRIFERFYRVDKGRSREQGGTGLGLAIVKHIIEAHKQSITVQSQLGKGTKFQFSLEAV
ncbi:MAG: ATP-binding protein [Bacteroidia bacterium]|nr:ATP-binding protein [Bacteroidia bacterium]